MVKRFAESPLDRTFAALGDPTRRAILARLAGGDAVTVSALAAPFAIKLPAVLKHLAVLGEAGLVTREKRGRVVTVRLAPEPMQDAIAWLEGAARFWHGRLDRLAAIAEARASEA